MVKGNKILFVFFACDHSFFIFEIVFCDLLSSMHVFSITSFQGLKKELPTMDAECMQGPRIFAVAPEFESCTAAGLLVYSTLLD